MRSVSDIHAVGVIAVASAVTMLIRFLPFAVFGGDKNRPAVIDYLADVLPCAIMGMLVVYCLKNVSLVTAPHGLPEFVACILVVLLHLWKRNTLLSIIAGTAAYMFLIQVVF